MAETDYPARSMGNPDSEASQPQGGRMAQESAKMDTFRTIGTLALATLIGLTLAGIIVYTYMVI